MVRLSTTHRLFSCHDEHPSSTLGILAFDTAKTMSRLISLYRSLTDKEITRLRLETLRSQGVTYLNMAEDLLSLAGSERLEALERTVTSISLLGKKCSDLGLQQFDLVYADLKQGWMDTGTFEFGSKNADKVVQKMEKLVSSTACLHSGMETLQEMEVSEKKLEAWRKTASPAQLRTADFGYFDKKIAYHRRNVRHYKNASLWFQIYDKVVGFMARTVCVVFSRICTVFGSYLSGLIPCSLIKVWLPKLHNLKEDHVRVYPAEITLGELLELKRPITSSGPIPKTTNNIISRGNNMLKFYSRELDLNLFLRDDSLVPVTTCYNKNKTERNKRQPIVFQSAPPSTVGGSGLTMQYAKVVVLAERLLKTATLIEEDARNVMYEMLPLGLRKKIRSKLKGSDLRNDEGLTELAEGWREAVEGIMRWLFPVADDTLRWQSERNFEKQKFDTRPTVLLVQTLHFSDLEKTEAAIVEVLVGLSCICKYENKVSVCSAFRETWRGV